MRPGGRVASTATSKSRRPATTRLLTVLAEMRISMRFCKYQMLPKSYASMLNRRDGSRVQVYTPLECGLFPIAFIPRRSGQPYEPHTNDRPKGA